MGTYIERILSSVLAGRALFVQVGLELATNTGVHATGERCHMQPLHGREIRWKQI